MNRLAVTGAQVLLADDDKGRGSPIGLFVVLALCVAVYFLWKSLNRHLKGLPESFDPPADQRPGTDAGRAESIGEDEPGASGPASAGPS